MHQLKRTKAEEDERIAAVLQQRMHDSERSAKELQQLRNESAELRDLQVRNLPSSAIKFCTHMLLDLKRWNTLLQQFSLSPCSVPWLPPGR